jgi:hypothetical protein
MKAYKLHEGMTKIGTKLDWRNALRITRFINEIKELWLLLRERHLSLYKTLFLFCSWKRFHSRLQKNRSSYLDAKITFRFDI